MELLSMNSQRQPRAPKWCNFNFTSMCRSHRGMFAGQEPSACSASGAGKLFPLYSWRCPLCKMFHKSRWAGKGAWWGRACKPEQRGALPGDYTFLFMACLGFLRGTG